MFGSLSLLPSLAVAGVTTSVSLATAMGGVQSLPQQPPATPQVRMAAVQATDTPSPTVTTAPPVAQAGARTDPATPMAQPPPPSPAVSTTTTTTTTTTHTVTAPPPATAASKPSTPAPPPPPPATPTQCTTWTNQGWTITWCAATTPGGPTTWTATNGSQTQSGIYYGTWSPAPPSGTEPWGQDQHQEQQQGSREHH